MKHIVIVGFMESGKSAVARNVSKQLGLPLISVDKLILNRMKMKASDFYDKFGEPYYRALESVTVEDLLSSKERSVIVLGSGAVLLGRTRQLLPKLGNVYYVKIKPTTVVERVKKSEQNSWIRKENLIEKVNEMLGERGPYYEESANVVIDADDLSLEEVAGRIVAKEA